MEEIYISEECLDAENCESCDDEHCECECHHELPDANDDYKGD